MNSKKSYQVLTDFQRSSIEAGEAFWRFPGGDRHQPFLSKKNRNHIKCILNGWTGVWVDSKFLTIWLNWCHKVVTATPFQNFYFSYFRMGKPTDLFKLNETDKRLNRRYMSEFRTFLRRQYGP